MNGDVLELTQISVDSLDLMDSIDATGRLVDQAEGSGVNCVLADTIVRDQTTPL